MVVKNRIASGTVWLMASQFVTIFSSYLIHASLARWLGPAAYGDFGVILSIIFVTKIFFLTGITLGVSKNVAEKAELAKSIYLRGMKLQLVISLVCLILFLFLSSYIAQWLKDPPLSKMILFSSLATFTLGLYSVGAKGFLNGLHRFKTQAVLESVLSVLRLVVAFMLVYWGLGLFGAVASYVIAPLIAFVITMAIIRRDNSFRSRSESGIMPSFGRNLLLKIALPMTFFYLLFTLTTEFSLLAVKRLIADDLQTGWYTAAITISKVVQSAFTALPLTIFPTVSKAYSENNFFLIKKYLQQYLRYIVMVIFPVAILISTNAEEIISLLYSSSYLSAARSLQILVFGFAGLAILLAQGSFLLGISRMIAATVISLISTVSIIFFCLWLIPKYSILGAALATLAASVFSLLISSTYLLVKLKALMPLASLFKILLTSIVLYFVSQWVKFPGKWFVFSAVLWLIVYFLVLIAVKEITVPDLQLLFSVLKLKKDNR